MRDTGIRGRRIEPRRVRPPATDRIRHCIVDFEDDALGAVFAVCPLVVFTNYRKAVQDVRYVLTRK
jgi:hypothetical protein